MKRWICLLLSLALAIALTACGAQETPPQTEQTTEEETPADDDGAVTMTWHEIGEGPSGWVIGITINNGTSSQFEQYADVTITDDSGDLLGKDTIHIDVASGDYRDYPVHCKKSDSYNVDVKKSENATSTDVNTNVSTGNELNSDDRGIPGMDPFAVKIILNSEPFDIPIPETIPEDALNPYCASHCSTTGGGDRSGVTYDYSLSLDSDGEIVGASFGITSTTATAQQLLTAADLYFYTVSLIQYDTSDEDSLYAWFSESLKNASDKGISTTIGDASFDLYGTPGIMYWVDISKADK